MTSILLINYYWPPSGGSAVQRWLDIIRYISQLEIKCYVVTIDENQATYPFIDHSLNNKVPENVKVYRTGTSELFDVYKKYIGKGKVPGNAMIDQPNPSLLQKLSQFARGNFFLPDPRRGWNKHAYIKAKELIKKYNIETVITAGPPHSSHLIGLKIKKELNINWVADIHDYWTDISYLKKFYRTKIAQFIDKKYEKSVIENTDLLMTHCQSSRKLLNSKVKENIDNKIQVHTMGFDQDLFTNNKLKSPQSNFIITYSGLLPDNYDPNSFFEALGKVVQNNPDVNIKLRIVGVLSPKVKTSIIDFGLENNLEEKGYVPHSQSIQFLYESSVLFLINPKFKNEKLHVPGKLYEYLAVRKPIISISTEDSENGEIIKKCEAGKNFARTEIKEITNYINELVLNWKESKNLDFENSNDVYKVYSRKYEAENLALKIKELANG